MKINSRMGNCSTASHIYKGGPRFCEDQGAKQCDYRVVQDARLHNIFNILRKVGIFDMSENLNHPQNEEVEINQPEEVVEDSQNAGEDVRGSGLMDKLKQTVPPVIGWCIFAGALVLATGIALLVLL